MERSQSNTHRFSGICEECQVWGSNKLSRVEAKKVLFSLSLLTDNNQTHTEYKACTESGRYGIVVKSLE
jgi:hypothetical protein